MSHSTDLWLAQLTQDFACKEKLQKYLDNSMICVEYNIKKTNATIRALISLAETMNEKNLGNIFVSSTKEILDQGLRTTVHYKFNTIREILDPEESVKFLNLIWIKACNYRLVG